MGDLTRRAFLRGTILTGATIAAGGLSTTSTTPVKVLPAAKSVIKFKNLNVLSPKAKAYRVFLKGLVGGAVTGYDPAGASDLRTSTKTLLTKGKEYRGDYTQGIRTTKTSVGRYAFETSIRKMHSADRMEAKQGVGNPGAQNIAIDMRTDKRARAGAGGKPKVLHGIQTRKLTARLTQGARNIMADELKAFRKANPERMFKKMSARKHSENMKTKSKGAKVGGGGKMALPGMESARNPTGMSLITQRYTL